MPAKHTLIATGAIHELGSFRLIGKPRFADSDRQQCRKHYKFHAIFRFAVVGFNTILQRPYRIDILKYN
ncbi:hypothetical protein A1355_00615 [Methylomonas koyamae]|uniref:Uncharacterized protein n=1 Tax=Methylomonas koyamae TaxID=702114 RepID=A0A177N9G5_9GAMM|nr:hypothetical protein A1355_00615 [Methylomonas koyamae]